MPFCGDRTGSPRGKEHRSMKTPLRLGATVALGALLLVGLLASPALAWEWGVSAEAVCEESGTTARVDFTVQSQEHGAEGDVTVVALVGGKPFGEPVTGSFGPGGDTVTGSFSGIALDAESVVVKALVQWKGQKEPEKDKAHVDLPTDCEAAPTTTTPPTTTPPTTAPPTTEDVLGGTSTTEGPALPFTGANSGPLLLAAVALVGGGFVILWASRLRGRHEAS
jgi:hypothetical protein